MAAMHPGAKKHSGHGRKLRGYIEFIYHEGNSLTTMDVNKSTPSASRKVEI